MINKAVENIGERSSKSKRGSQEEKRGWLYCQLKQQCVKQHKIKDMRQRESDEDWQMSHEDWVHRKKKAEMVGAQGRITTEQSGGEKTGWKKQRGGREGFGN